MMEFTHQNGVAVLRMADGKANAMDVEFCDALAARFEEHRQSSSQAIVLIGSGRIFSAGVDLLLLLDGGAPYIRAFLPKLGEMFAAVFSHPKPVVAAINFTKAQMRAPVVERWQAKSRAAEAEEIWTSPEALGRIRDYVKRTLSK